MQRGSQTRNSRANDDYIVVFIHWQTLYPADNLRFKFATESKFTPLDTIKLTVYIYVVKLTGEPMVRPIKKNQIPNLQEAIKDTAWTQITEFGAPALSLRAIARQLKISAPAIYNYFPDRDALVTALIVDAFTSFGDWQLEAKDSIASDDPAGRLEAIGIAYRNWAHTYPQRYQLIFGTPIPGYKGPLDIVLPSSVRSLSALVSVVEGMRVAGKLNIGTFPKV